MTEHNIRLEDIMPLIREKLEAGQTVRIDPHGTSMLPMIVQGRDTVVLAAISGELKKYDLPLYQRDNGQYVLHRIVKVTKDGYECVGDNQISTERGIEMRHMIGVVVSFNHGGKEYSVDSLSYRIYCRFWHYTRPIRRIYRGVLSRFRRLFKK